MARAFVSCSTNALSCAKGGGTMMRGTTPKHMFELPFDTEEIQELHVLYAQNDELVLKKTKADCVLDGSTVSVTLTQQETLQFESDKNVKIQLRVLTKAGQALASRPHEESVYSLLEDEVIE